MLFVSFLSVCLNIYLLTSFASSFPFHSLFCNFEGISAKLYAIMLELDKSEVDKAIVHGL